MKILFLGDIVGRHAREKIYDTLPGYIEAHQIDFTIINAENAAGGFGITQKISQDLFDAGADALTMGNHTWDNREIYGFIDKQPRLIRPANYPKGTPGYGASMLQSKQGMNVLVVNLLGRVFMHPVLDCPFEVIDRELIGAALGEYCDAIIVDMHAEATSEKQSIGYYLDGRVSAVIGSHTHVPTADEKILPKGTAYQTDAGMCGVYDSVLGMDKQEPLSRFTTKLNSGRYKPAEGKATLCGAIIQTDDKTGLATDIERIKI
ncbi:MAG: TIGR00282 family metallophosphoesterase [Pseudomonadota bacterium]